MNTEQLKLCLLRNIKTKLGATEEIYEQIGQDSQLAVPDSKQIAFPQKAEALQMN
jgi:hypothetical protein